MTALRFILVFATIINTCMTNALECFVNDNDAARTEAGFALCALRPATPPSLYGIDAFVGENADLAKLKGLLGEPEGFYSIRALCVNQPHNVSSVAGQRPFNFRTVCVCAYNLCNRGRTATQFLEQTGQVLHHRSHTEDDE